MGELDKSVSVIEAKNVSISYGAHKVIENLNFKAHENASYALIGPSGCGKSSFLRALNRMNDFIDSFHLEGEIFYRGHSIYANEIDPVAVRRRIGMVFQKPNPFPRSIAKNISWGPKINGFKVDIPKLVEESLQRAALWDEVKDRLNDSGLSLSGGQQQRLCIARAIAMNPDVILMDEPCASLDPISTKKIEELILELKKHYTLIVVTHNMQQACRIADYTAFLYHGELVEFGETKQVFENPAQRLTADYVCGRFG